MDISYRFFKTFFEYKNIFLVFCVKRRTANDLNYFFFQIDEINTYKFVTNIFINFFIDDFFILVDKSHQKFFFVTDIESHHTDFEPACIS